MPFALSVGAGVLGTAAAAELWGRFKRRVFALTLDRDTGVQRRAMAPPNVDAVDEYYPGCVEHELATKRELQNERGFLTLRNGFNIFHQSWGPLSGEVKAVVIFFHGYGDHSDFVISLKARALCNLGPMACVGFDMPGHGRSDGLHVHIPDWHDFVGTAREILVEHLLPAIRGRWPGARLFGFGESMGGGVLFSLLVRERDLFQGAIMVCPMLFVSEDILPPFPILKAFLALSNCLPLWPIAPNKDVKQVCNADEKFRAWLLGESKYQRRLIPMAQPRLLTGYNFVTPASEYMRGKIPEFDTPALIIHGGADVVCDHRVSEELFQKMRNADKTFLYPEGVWHMDLFHGGPKMNEGIKARLEAVAAWIVERS